MYMRQKAVFPHKRLHAVTCVLMYNEYQSSCGISSIVLQVDAVVNLSVD